MLFTPLNGLDRPGKPVAQLTLVGVCVIPTDVMKKRDKSGKVFYKGLANAFSHKEIECRNGLSAVLFVLVCLKNDGGQCRIALYRLWGTDGTVLCTESSFKKIVQVVLYAGGCFGWIIIKVVYMYIAVAVCSCILNTQQVFIGIIFGYLRGECHHLTGRGVGRHVGIAQIHIIFLDSHNPVHHLFHVCLLIALDSTPFTVDYILFGYVRVAYHKFFFYQILNLFHTDLSAHNCRGYFLGNLIDGTVFFLNATRSVCFQNRILNLVDGKSFAHTIALGN